MKDTLIIIGLVLFFTAIIYGSIKYKQKHPCIESHTEIQYSMPPSMVVGQSEYFGGIAMPIGNATPEEVTVCDKTL